MDAVCKGADCWPGDQQEQQKEQQQQVASPLVAFSELEEIYEIFSNSSAKRKRGELFPFRDNHLQPQLSLVDTTTQNPGAVPYLSSPRLLAEQQLQAHRSVQKNQQNNQQVRSLLEQTFTADSAPSSTAEGGGMQWQLSKNTATSTNNTTTNMRQEPSSNSTSALRAPNSMSSAISLQHQGMISHATRMRQKRQQQQEQQQTKPTLPTAHAHHHGNLSNIKTFVDFSARKRNSSGRGGASKSPPLARAHNSNSQQHLRVTISSRLPSRNSTIEEGRDDPETDKRQQINGRHHNHHHSPQQIKDCRQHSTLHEQSHHDHCQQQHHHIPHNNSLGNSSAMPIMIPTSEEAGNDQDENDAENAHYIQSETTCDYDKSPTVLYELLEASDWEQAKDRTKSHTEEARTWIIRKDKSQRIRWKLLPLHASIIFQAPTTVILSLLDTYPAAARRRDDQGMLPLHLAFRHKQEDEALLEALLRQYPKAVCLKDKRDRVPLQHGRDLKFSSKVMKCYAEAHVAAAIGNQDALVLQPSSTRSSEHDNKQRGIVLSFSLNSASDAAQQTPSLQYIMEAEIDKLNQKHQEDLRKLMAQYEDQLATMRERIDQEARTSKEVAAEERRQLLDQHKIELDEMREMLSNQVNRETAMMQDLQAQIDDLQTALENSNLRNEQLKQEFQSIQQQQQQNNKKDDEDLRQELQKIIQDQILIHNLASRQSSELEAARRARAQIIQTLVQQENTDEHNDRIRVSKLLEVTETVRERAQILIQRSGGDNSVQQQQQQQERQVQSQHLRRGVSRMEREREQQQAQQQQDQQQQQSRIRHKKHHKPNQGIAEKRDLADNHGDNGDEDDDIEIHLVMEDDPHCHHSPSHRIEHLQLLEEHVDITRLSPLGDDISAITEHSL